MGADTVLLFGAAGTLALVIAAQNWRHALLLVIVLGFSQDAIRKLVPGEPVAVIMLSSLMVAAAVTIAITRVGMISLHPLTQGDRRTLIILTAFIALVFVQALLSFVRYNSLVVPAIGVLSYLSPIPAVWLIYKYVRRPIDCRKFFMTYIYCGFLVALSVIADKLGLQSILLVEVGEGLDIYDRNLGIYIEAYTGLMRSPEVAAWHLGASAVLLTVMAVSFKRGALRWATPGLVLMLLLVATLTGRRKVLIMVAAFAVVYFLLLMYYRQRSGIRAMLVSTLGAGLLTLGALSVMPDDSAVDPYVSRGVTVFSDVGERFQQLGIGTIGGALRAAGPWGLGAGSVSQGTQHFGGALGSARANAEGGLGKIVVELGIPGLVLGLLSAFMVAKSIRVALSTVAAADPQVLRINLGLLAFVAGNIPIFISASQIYGDPFVLFVLGSCIGFVLAGPRLVEVKARLAERRAADLETLPAVAVPLPTPGGVR